MRRRHAEHNLKCCNALHGLGGYNDWVVTTAFYASLHFALHEIFPFSDRHSEVAYDGLNYYYDALKGRYQNVKSKHMITVDLIREYLPAIKTKYSWLFDACYNARYTNYRVSKEKADMALKYMDDIAIYCKKPSTVQV